MNETGLCLQRRDWCQDGQSRQLGVEAWGALGRPFGGGGKGPRQPWLLEAWTTWAGFLGGEICWA